MTCHNNWYSHTRNSLRDQEQMKEPVNHWLCCTKHKFYFLYYDQTTLDITGLSKDVEVHNASQILGRESQTKYVQNKTY